MALRQAVEGKIVAVTGSSDGIGARLAVRLGAAGARVLLLARSEQKLQEVGDSIRAAGGEAYEYIANLSVEADCDRALSQILADHGRVDIFVSNAGRSIRRSVKYQGAGRFHDFQRLTSLNYFGALRMILGVLPGMAERGTGQVVHVSSFAVPTRQPRFAGYSASKSALDSALQCAAGEVLGQGVHMSTVYMPLVQTKMVQSKGHSYDHVTMLTVDMACELIEHAIVTKTVEVIDGPSRFLQLLHIFRPSLINRLNALVYGLEREQAPDAAPLPKKRSNKKLEKARPRGGNPVLGFLGRLMWFFSRLEYVLVIRIGLPVIIRELIIMLILTFTLVVAPVCEGVSWIVRTTRRFRSLGTQGAAQPQRHATSEGNDKEQQQIPEQQEHGRGSVDVSDQAEEVDGLVNGGAGPSAPGGRAYGRRVSFEEPASTTVATPFLTAQVTETVETNNADAIEGAESQNKAAASFQASLVGGGSFEGRRSRSRRTWHWSSANQPCLRFRSLSRHSVARKRRHTLH